jgi:hypothetical protein
MSVKFQEQVTRSVQGAPAPVAAAAAAVLGDGATKAGEKIKHPVLHEVGEVLTQGGGAGGYLAVC